MCKVTFAMERETKNTVRFTEVLQGKMTNPVVGTIYIQKDALKAKGWEDGKGITIDIGLAEDVKMEGVTTAAEKNAAATAKYKEAQAKKKAVKKAPAKKAATKAAPAKKTPAKAAGKAKTTRTRRAAK